VSLQVRLQRSFEDFELAVEFSVPGQGMTALFGASGAGKTLTLRAIAGLDRVPNGEVIVNGTVWQQGDQFRSPEQRSVGYVFQEASLFDHLDVAGNIDFGLRRRVNINRNERQHLIELLELGPILQRRTHTLSGGERQRVALARALAPQPQLLLMDEPLSALDRARKAEIIPYLDALTRQLEIPVILVSHDHAEVARLADHLVLISDGQVQGSGPLNEMLTRLDQSLALDADAGAVLEGVVLELEQQWGLARIEAGGTNLLVPAAALEPGDQVRLQIAARDVSLVRQPPNDSSILNILPVRIAGLDAHGPLVNVRLTTADGSALLSRISRKSASDLGLQTGMKLHAQVKGIALLGDHAGHH